MTYLRRNLPPEIQDVFFLQRGIFFKPHSAKYEGAQTVILKPDVLNKLRLPKSLDDFYGILVEEGRDPFQRMLQGEKKGMLTLSWDVLDDNDDFLDYSIYYQRYGDKEWKLFAKDIQQIVYSFDTQALTDGKYHFRLFATDAPSNMKEDSYTVSMDSELITIDNTAPEISHLQVNKNKDSLHVSFSVSDKLSPITVVQYAIDGKEFHLIPSKDGIVDSLNEDFLFKVDGQTPGSHFIVVKCMDWLGNESTDKAEFHW
jgi:hypothetical protein